MDGLVITNLLTFIFVIINYKFIQNLLDKDLLDFPNPKIYIASRCYSYFFVLFAFVYYLERLFYPYRREKRRIRKYQKLLINLGENHLNERVSNIENADKLFKIYPFLSKYSELYDENDQLIVNEYSSCFYTFMINKKNNNDWEISFYTSPMMQAKINSPFGASLTSGEWIWQKYIFSDEFKNNNFDLTKLPFFGNRPLILDTEGNYIESPNSEEE